MVALRDLPSGNLIKLHLETEFFVQYSSTIYKIIDRYIPTNYHSNKFDTFTNDLCLCLICNCFYPKDNDHHVKDKYQIPESIGKSYLTAEYI